MTDVSLRKYTTYFRLGVLIALEKSLQIEYDLWVVDSLIRILQVDTSAR
jgi:hypothetical protein